MPGDLGELVDLISARASKPRDKILREIDRTYKRLAIIRLEAAACMVGAKYGVEPFEECLKRFPY